MFLSSINPPIGNARWASRKSAKFQFLKIHPANLIRLAYWRKEINYGSANILAQTCYYRQYNWLLRRRNPAKIPNVLRQRTGYHSAHSGIESVPSLLANHRATSMCAERVLACGAGVQERPGRTQQVQDPLDDLSQVSAQLLPARGLPILLQPSP